MPGICIFILYTLGIKSIDFGMAFLKLILKLPPTSRSNHMIVNESFLSRPTYNCLQVTDGPEYVAKNTNNDVIAITVVFLLIVIFHMCQ